MTSQRARTTSPGIEIESSPRAAELLSAKVRGKAMDVVGEEQLAILECQLRSAAPHMFALSAKERRVAILLLRELARGQPITLAALPQALGIPPPEVEAFLKQSHLGRMVYWDHRDRVAGFWGLSTIRTQHQLTVQGHALWSWCALDSLFLPELIGHSAEIESEDPESGERIRLTVSPDYIDAVAPKGVVLSMMCPDAADMTSAVRIISTACHFIHFFTSNISADRWIARHPGTALLSLDEAFAFAKRQNEWLLGTNQNAYQPKGTS